MSALAFRPAQEEDLDRLIEIHGACFPDARGAAARRRNFEQNPLGQLADLVVACRGEALIAHAFAFSLRAFFGGKPVPIVGIASVGVAPEARGQGVATALIEHIHEEASQAGAVLAMLFAYRHGFYARLGYAEVATTHRLGCDPRAVPRAWVSAAHAMGLRAATGADRDALLACYHREAARKTGWLDRPAAFWSRLLLAERSRVVVAPRADAGGVRGYVVFEIEQDEPHAEARMLVEDLVCDDDDTRRALWGFLGAQAGQVAEMEIEIDARDPMPFALTDIDGRRAGTERIEHDLGSIVAGPMIRMLDARRALAARGYEGNPDGTAVLVVDGDALRLEVEGGAGRVASAADGGGASEGSRIDLDARTLASLAFGGLGAADAGRLGLVRGAPGDVAKLDAMLRLPPFHARDRF